MPGEDDALVDPGVAEEAEGGLGGGPVPADRREGAADRPSQVAWELAQARLQIDLRLLLFGRRIGGDAGVTGSAVLSRPFATFTRSRTRGLSLLFFCSP